MAGLTGLAFTGQTALSSLLMAMVGLPAMASLLIVIHILGQRTNAEVDIETIRFGLHTSFVVFLTSLANTDTIIINRYLSPADVAIYSIALVFPKQVKSLYGVFGQLFAPRIYEADSVTEAWDYLKKKLVVLVGVFTLIGVAGFFAIPIFVPLLFSQRYASAVPYTKWMWLTLAMTGPTVYLGNILRAQQKVSFVYIYSVTYYSLLFVAYLALVRFGVFGMALARSLMYVVSALIYGLSFLYYLKSSPTLIRKA
jgi:O-antigen/teichoic acid export membrane protein